MSTHTILYLTIVLTLVGLSVQSLNKRPLLPGLGQLDFSFLRAPERRPSTSGGDKSLCDCSGKEPDAVNTVKYYGSSKQSLVLCMCPNPVMSAQYMIETMGKVPFP